MLDEKWTFFEFATEPALRNVYHQFFEGFDIKRFDFIEITERYEQDLRVCASLLGVELAFSAQQFRLTYQEFFDALLIELQEF